MRWLFQIYKYPCKIIGNVRKQGDITPQKGCDHFLLTNPKEMVICELPEKNKKQKTHSDYFREAQWDLREWRQTAQWTLKKNTKKKVKKTVINYIKNKETNSRAE